MADNLSAVCHLFGCCTAYLKADKDRRTCDFCQWLLMTYSIESEIKFALSSARSMLGAWAPTIRTYKAQFVDWHVKNSFCWLGKNGEQTFSAIAEGQIKEKKWKFTCSGKIKSMSSSTMAEQPSGGRQSMTHHLILLSVDFSPRFPAVTTVLIGYYDYLGTRPKNSHRPVIVTGR